MGSASTSTVLTGSLGTAAQPLEWNIRAWHAGVRQHRMLVGGSEFIKEPVHLCRVLRRSWHQMFRMFILVYSFFSNIAPGIGPHDISHWVRGRRAIAVSQVVTQRPDASTVSPLSWCHWCYFTCLGQDIWSRYDPLTQWSQVGSPVIWGTCLSDGCLSGQKLKPGTCITIKKNSAVGCLYYGYLVTDF